jgi:hypothetical protein
LGVRAWLIVFVCACGPAQPPAEMPEPEPPFPVTRGEKQGQTYLYDPIVEPSHSCAPKAGAIELRLYTIDINRLTLRLTAKNCSSREVRLFHDGDLQPSQLVFSGQGKPVAAPDDDRKIRKFDNTVKSAEFVKIAPGEERVLEEAYVSENGIQWQCFRYRVPSGTWTVKVTFTSKIQGGTDGKVPNAWLGTIASNAVSVRVP